MFWILGFLKEATELLILLVVMAIMCCIALAALYLTIVGCHAVFKKLFPGALDYFKPAESIAIDAPSCCGKYVQQQTKKIEDMTWITWLLIWWR